MPLDRAIVLAIAVGFFALTLPSGSSLPVHDPFPLRLPAELTAPLHAPVPETNVGIGPGAHLFIKIPGEGTFICTANFVWTSGGKTYLGSAGHCLIPEHKTATHGPGADYDASGVEVRVCVYGCSFGGHSGSLLRGNEIALGKVAYARQTGAGGDFGNDFGVVEIPASELHRVRPTLPVWGGPTTATPTNARLGGPICMYGSGVLVGESFATMARAGAGVGQYDSRGYWDAVLPVYSGDSGGPVVSCSTHTGGAHGIAPVGIITHGLIVGPGYGIGTTIAKAKALATQAGLDLELVVA